MVQAIMSPIIFLILVLTYAAKANLPGLSGLPNLDGPISAVKDTLDDAKTDVNGMIGIVPEFIKDSFGNVLNINKMPGKYLFYNNVLFFFDKAQHFFKSDTTQEAPVFVLYQQTE